MFFTLNIIPSNSFIFFSNRNLLIVTITHNDTIQLFMIILSISYTISFSKFQLLSKIFNLQLDLSACYACSKMNLKRSISVEEKIANIILNLWKLRWRSPNRKTTRLVAFNITNLASSQKQEHMPFFNFLISLWKFCTVKPYPYKNKSRLSQEGTKLKEKTLFHWFQFYHFL